MNYIISRVCDYCGHDVEKSSIDRWEIIIQCTNPRCGRIITLKKERSENETEMEEILVSELSQTKTAWAGASSGKDIPD